MKELFLLCVLGLSHIYLAHATSIRFAGPGSNATQGRVEIQYNGTTAWGTICDDGFDSNYEATVICRMLNITNVNRGRAVNSTRFGEGTGDILLDDLACDGTERDISQCVSRGWNVSDCTHKEDIGVICDTSGLGTTASPVQTTKAPPVVQPSNCSTDNNFVRLIGPDNMNGIGFVEVNLNNRWGSVCDDMWGTDDAKVVCGMLCYNKDDARAGAPVEVDYVRDNVSLTTNLDNVECYGNETNILNCRTKTGADISSNCLNNRDQFASVSCVTLINAPPPDPVPDLTCDGTVISASFSKIRDPKLEEKHLSLANGLTCTGLDKRSDVNFVTISIPFGSCNTTDKTNETHIIFTNVIRYDYTTQIGNRVRVNRYNVEVSCEFPRELIDNKEMEPLTQFVTQKAPGEFKINMLFFKNNSFVHPEQTYPLQLTLGEWINVGLYLESIGANLKLVVPDCVATPSLNRDDPVNYPIFHNKCPNDPTLAFFPMNSSAFGYRYQTFKFVDYDSVILHCKAFVCVLDEETAFCDRSCNTTTTTTTTAAPSGRRRKREATHHHEYIHVSSPPMFFHKKSGDSNIIRQWDSTTPAHGSPSVVTVPMTITTRHPVRSSTHAITRQPTTTSTKTPTITTTVKPTTSTQRPTTSTQRPTTLTQRPTTSTQRPTTTSNQRPTTTSPTGKATITTPTSKSITYTTSHKIIKVTSSITPTGSSKVTNNQSGNNKTQGQIVDIKTTKTTPSQTVDNKLNSAQKDRTIDINDFNGAGLAGKPISQSSPLFNYSQAVVSVCVMVLSVVLLG